MKTRSNEVVFVSLGPGDPELISLKGLRVLSDADSIFCPCTTMPNGNISSRAMDILSDLKIDRQKIVLFNVPMNKDRSKAIESYKNASNEIIGHYKKGLKIAVTAEGDAGFYSSVHYINTILDDVNIPVKRISGIPAFIACGTLANIHIVKQEEELNIIPGIISFETLQQKLDEGKTLVIMKTSQCVDVIKRGIKDIHGVTFHYFENVGVVNKEFYTKNKEEILLREFPYFSLVIINKSI